LGGLAFFMFLLLTVTGVLLMFYYIPSVDTAYQNMKELETTVTFGMFLRNMHRYAAHAMVLLVFLHMCRVFYTGAYKPPREFNWTIGVALLAITLLLSFTGYLLPWDQLALWAVTVGTNMAGSTPFVGDWVRFLLIGGYEVGQNTLLRFYTLHVIVLPLVAAVLIAVHFWRVRKDGGISGPL
jgi:quinol-cytochrome oxidoreductase complex cytochrome b subunit